MEMYRVSSCAAILFFGVLLGPVAWSQESDRPPTGGEGGVVQVIAANGEMAPSGRVGELAVMPGQVVSLCADQVSKDAQGGPSYAYRPVQDFLWVANDQEGDSCDPNEDCKAHSNFETTDYGVNYYVPWSAPAHIRLSVRLRSGGGEDTLDLVNDSGPISVADDSASIPAPIDPALSVATPGAPDLAAESSPEVELAGLGYWTALEGRMAFVPMSYEKGWAPYRHGYWYWTSEGWTWYSYDPWGEVTDHCGHWRHSRAFDWVWFPEAECSWKPAVVGFLSDSETVGWAPYDSAWAQGSEDPAAFDDEYSYAGAPGSGFDPLASGLTLVDLMNFYLPGNAAGGSGAYDVAQARRSDADAQHYSSTHQGALTAVVGGGTDRSGGRDFIARRTGVQIVAVNLSRPTLIPGHRNQPGSRVWFRPEKVLHPVPAPFVQARLEARRSLATPVSRPAVRMPLSRLIGGTRPDAGPARGLAIPPARYDQARQRTLWAPRGLQASPNAGSPAAAPGSARPLPVIEKGHPGSQQEVLSPADRRKQAEEARRLEREHQQAEKLRIAEEAKQKAGEARRVEQERKQAEIERKAAEARQVLEARKQAEDAKRLESERQQAEKLRVIEDGKQKAEQARRVEQERKQAEIERKAAEARQVLEARRQAEEAKRLEVQRQQAEKLRIVEEAKQRVVEARRLEQERKQAEIERKAAEIRQAEEARRQAEEARKAAIVREQQEQLRRQQEIEQERVRQEQLERQRQLQAEQERVRQLQLEQLRQQQAEQARVRQIQLEQQRRQQEIDQARAREAQVEQQRRQQLIDQERARQQQIEQQRRQQQMEQDRARQQQIDQQRRQQQVEQERARQQQAEQQRRQQPRCGSRGSGCGNGGQCCSGNCNRGQCQ